jgi:hypothetical protein
MASKRIDELDARVVADTDLLPVTPSGGPSVRATVAAIVAEGLSQPNSGSAGAGASLSIIAADGVTSGAGGSIILEPGAQATTGGNGSVVIRQPGGTAGTNECQISNDGTITTFNSKNGEIYLYITKSQGVMRVARGDVSTRYIDFNPDASGFGAITSSQTGGIRFDSSLMMNQKKISFSNGGNTEHASFNLDEFLGEIEYRDYNKKMVAEGFEGIMIKDPDAKYECKRSASWLKQKPFIEVSLTIVAVEEGTGRNVGKLGALVCEGEDDGKLIKVNVGSGFSDGDRDSFYQSRDTLPNQVVEVRADAVTQNQDGTYSLRFPRFLRFRGFKAGEKI